MSEEKTNQETRSHGGHSERGSDRSESRSHHGDSHDSDHQGGGERSGGGHGGGYEKRRSQRPRYRKKVLDTRNLVIDYKNPETLERFISKTGKILPRRMTGANARIQRKIAREIKRARMINLLPFSRR